MKTLISISAAILLISNFTLATSLPAPTGKVILTVTGMIEATNLGNSAQLDLSMIENLPIQTYESFTSWTDGRQAFEGVLLRDIIRKLGATGTAAVAVALNDYEIEIPISDAFEYDVLIAFKKNGRYLAVRDKGPLWIIYPEKAPGEMHSPPLTQAL